MDIAFRTIPATEVGGDYFDFKETNDGTLNIAVGDQVAFNIGTIASGSNPVIGNYVPVVPLFQLTNADNGTYANAIVPNINQSFNAGDQLAVVGTESGAVTPNTGELSITFIFQAKI